MIDVLLWLGIHDHEKKLIVENLLIDDYELNRTLVNQPQRDFIHLTGSVYVIISSDFLQFTVHVCALCTVCRSST